MRKIDELVPTSIPTQENIDLVGYDKAKSVYNNYNSELKDITEYFINSSFSSVNIHKSDIGFFVDYNDGSKGIIHTNTSNLCDLFEDIGEDLETLINDAGFCRIVYTLSSGKNGDLEWDFNFVFSEGMYKGASASSNLVNSSHRYGHVYQDLEEDWYYSETLWYLGS